jgi:hypothetical protein
MSYAKSKRSQDPEFIKLPGTHLKKNLVDMKSNEDSNQPRYVRHRRRKESIFKDRHLNRQSRVATGRLMTKHLFKKQKQNH